MIIVTFEGSSPGTPRINGYQILIPESSIGISYHNATYHNSFLTTQAREVSMYELRINILVLYT